MTRALKLWDPFHELDDVHEIMSSIVERPFHSGRNIRNYPLVDVYQKKDVLTVVAEIPGMGSEDVEISGFGDTLTIQGERKPNEDIAYEDYWNSELAFGKFIREINLPMPVDFDKVKAVYSNGMVMITLPILEKTKPKEIEIQIGN